MTKGKHRAYICSIKYAKDKRKRELLDRIIILSNGKRVANFSSAHAFTYEDGSTLPGVPTHESKKLEVTFIERDGKDGDVYLSFSLSKAICDEMEIWKKIHKEKRVDIVICPLPMITAIKEKINDDIWEGNTYTPIEYTPFRAIRIEDRIKKLCSINKQCI